MTPSLEFDLHLRLILFFYFLRNICSWNGQASSDLGRKRVRVGRKRLRACRWEAELGGREKLPDNAYGPNGRTGRAPQPPCYARLSRPQPCSLGRLPYASGLTPTEYIF
jgi:hypothetical protein